MSSDLKVVNKNIVLHFQTPHSLISEDSSVEYFLFIQLKGLKPPEKQSWGGKTISLWVDPESVWRRPELAQEGVQSTSQAIFSCSWHRRLEDSPRFPALLSEIVSIPPHKGGFTGAWDWTNLEVWLFLVCGELCMQKANLMAFSS